MTNTTIVGNTGGRGGSMPGTGVGTPYGPAGSGALDLGGSGAFAPTGVASVIHCTIGSNARGSLGSRGAGGIHVLGIATVENSIVFGNTGGQSLTTTPASGLSGVTTSLTVSHSDVAGGGVGNLDVDPLFRDATGGDFHIDPCSPRVDAAPEALVGLPIADADGEPRRIGPAPDIGADEADTSQTGTCEDFETLVNGTGDPTATTKVVAQGDVFEVTIRSPGGQFTGAVPLLVGQLLPAGFEPAPIFGYPSIHVNGRGVTVVFDGFNAGPLGLITLPPAA